MLKAYGEVEILRWFQSPYYYYYYNFLLSQAFLPGILLNQR